MDKAGLACERPAVPRAWAPPLAFVVRVVRVVRVVPVLLALVVPRAHAQTDDGAQLFHAAEEDDQRRAFAKAADEYERAVKATPSAGFVPRAQARARTLRSHAEGDFAPFTALEVMRADRAAADDPQALDDLAARADGFPPGQVRGEARLLVAEAYAGRLHQPARAVPLLEKVAADPSADPLTARLALDMLVDVELDLGRLDDARDTVTRHAAIAEPSLTARVRTLVRRRALHRTSLGVLAVTFAAVAIVLARARTRGEIGAASNAIRASYKLIAGFFAYVAITGALLATFYERGTSAPFVAFGVAALPITFGARAWAAVGSPRPAARAARTLVCGASVVAAAFLVLEWIDVEYLKGFGL